MLVTFTSGSGSSATGAADALGAADSAGAALALALAEADADAATGADADADAGAVTGAVTEVGADAEPEADADVAAPGEPLPSPTFVAVGAPHPAAPTKLRTSIKPARKAGNPALKPEQWRCMGRAIYLKRTPRVDIRAGHGPKTARCATIRHMKTLSRRRFLRGAGGIAIALPFLNAMAPTAKALEPPKRFIAFFTGLGTVKPRWVPIGTETSFTLSDVLAPLEPFKDKLVVVEGVDMKSAYSGPGDPHQQGIAQALTATELQEGALFPYACNPSKMVGWGGGISLDQLLALEIGQTTKFPSLELGVQVQYSNVSSRISYLGAGKPVPPDDDPWHVFARIFTDLQTDPAVLAQLKADRKRVLDSVKGDYDSLMGQLGYEDRQKLDAHVTAIADIESHLDTTGALGGACQIPFMGAPIDVYANDNYPAIAKAQLDMLAMAFACDLTRVASVQWTTVQTGKVFSWLGITQTHHDLSHSSISDKDSEQKLVNIGNWHAQQLAYLMGKLKEIPEGDGTVLDNTVIFWCTDIAQGQSHARLDMPYLLAGGAGGAWKTGRYIQRIGEPHNNLLVSIANAMGVPLTTFGNKDFCTGPMII